MNGFMSRPMKNAGFTLIEVMVALLVMAVTMTVLLKSASGLQDQSRHNQTVERVHTLRTAILHSATLQGSPVLNGFVADMGRLPDNLRELLERRCDDPARCPPWASGRCLDAGGNPLAYYTVQDCKAQAAANQWLDHPGGLGVGWRGPYIQPGRSARQSDAYADGWGKTSFLDARYGGAYADQTACTSAGFDWNGDSGVCEDAMNYGWHYLLDAGRDTAVLSSYGADGVPGTASCTLPEYIDPESCTDNGGDWLAGGACSNAVYTDQASCTCNGGIWSADGEHVYQSDYPDACPDPNVASPPAPPPLIAAGDWLVPLGQGIGVQMAPVAGGICRQNNVTDASCYANAGRWENCLLLSATSCQAAGGFWVAECHVTESVCTAKGGNWNAGKNPQCSFGATLCPTLGGTWSATKGQCILDAAACENLMNRSAMRFCLFDAGVCQSWGGTWNEDGQVCKFTDSGKCTAPPVSGVAVGSGSNGACLRVFRTPATGVLYDEESCRAAGHVWQGMNRSVPLCMKLFYRDTDSGAGLAVVVSDGDSGDLKPVTPVVFEENGLARTLSFRFPADVPTRHPGRIPGGPVGVGIFEYDAENGICSDILYPAGRKVVVLNLLPRAHLPVINW